MNTKLMFVLGAILCLGGLDVGQAGGVRNGSLGKKNNGIYLKDSAVQALRAKGWTCPDARDWPLWWGGHGSKVKFEIMASGGKAADAYARISGGGGYVTDYHGLDLEDRNYILTIWAKGKGTLKVGFNSYKLGPAGDRTRPIWYTSGPRPLFVKVDSDKWVRYRHVMQRSAELWQVHVTVAAREGTVDFDEVDLRPAEPAVELMVLAEKELYGKGTLVEDQDALQVDDAFLKKCAEYTVAVKAMRENAEAMEPNLRQSLKKEISRLDAYVSGAGKTVVLVPHYNDMIVLTRVCRRLAGQEAAEEQNAAKPGAALSGVSHKPGERRARPDTVTITDIRSNKVRYDENEKADTKATMVNTSERRYKGTLIALMHLGLDTVREIERQPVTLGPGKTWVWRFSYNVGAETYGRGIEVRFVDRAGTVMDTWQEFYAVAAEWFRVQQHTYAAQMKNYKVSPWVTYYNQRHYFASEPTDFGVRTSEVEEYTSGQAGYHVRVKARKDGLHRHFRRAGVMGTFYQTYAFCGVMGYEEVRQHPEYVLYDANGQFGVDPVYGGYPNPMELASPMEIGPKRKPTKPYLDRQYTPWQHLSANFALEKVVVYGANRTREYAKALGFDGVYFDGCLGVRKGYGYDGKPNVPTDRDEDYARLNARNHRIWSEILKRDAPNFGTWYNWHYPTEAELLWKESKGIKSYCGSGCKGDVSDESIRAAAGWENVMFLNERQIHSFTRGHLAYPERLLRTLADNRDYIVQRYGANHLIGYFFLPTPRDAPGHSKWAWSTVNYMGGQFIATQVHFVTAFMPSWRPTLQFTTRYCRFIWAPDVKVVSVAEKLVRISSPEAVFWKPLVYRLKLPEHDHLIVHLVRIPPTEKWDFNWVDEPAPLEGVEVTVNLGNGELQTAQAMRPYHFEEEQQPIQEILAPRASGSEVTVTPPPFRYHTMVVFRIAESRGAKSKSGDSRR